MFNLKKHDWWFCLNFWDEIDNFEDRGNELLLKIWKTLSVTCIE